MTILVLQFYLVPYIEEVVMKNGIESILLLAIVVLLLGIGYGQRGIIENQKIQMKQQYHSDFISLISLFGEDGLKKMAITTNPRDLTMKESFATGLLLQRFIVAHRIRDAFSDEEWKYTEMDIKAAMKGSQLLRARWEQVRTWYSPEIRSFLDKIVFDVLSEKEKIEILRDRFTNKVSSE